MSLYQDAATIVKRLQLEMPVAIVLPDPISGSDFALTRENIFSALVVDAPNLVTDAQSLAANYGAMARAQRACERASANAEIAYRKWKAQRSEEFRKKNADRKITVAEVEESYRAHPDYESVSSTSVYYEKLAGLFDDLKQAFRIKGEMVKVTANLIGGDLAARYTEARVENRSESSGGLPPMPPPPSKPRRTPG